MENWGSVGQTPIDETLKGQRKTVYERKKETNLNFLKNICNEQHLIMGYC
jgi:hypothetical protein